MGQGIVVKYGRREWISLLILNLLIFRVQQTVLLSYQVLDRTHRYSLAQKSVSLIVDSLEVVNQTPLDRLMSFA
jgi:hypothetical protein